MFYKFYLITLIFLVGCSYNPDIGKFIQFKILKKLDDRSVYVEKINFKNKSISNKYKELIERQIKSDLANSSPLVIYDYNHKVRQVSLKQPDYIIKIDIDIEEIDQKILVDKSVIEYTNETVIQRSGKGRNIKENKNNTYLKKEKIVQLPLYLGIANIICDVKIYDRSNISLIKSKESNLLKIYTTDHLMEYYPFFENTFILDNIHELSGLIVNSIIFENQMNERKIEDSHGEQFIYNIKKGLIQKEIADLKYKIAFTNNSEMKSIYIYYLGLIHEIIGQPLIAYEYYENSIESDWSNNLPHLAMGIIDRNRRM